MNTELKKFDELASQITSLVAPVKEVKVSDHASSGSASKAFRDLTEWEKKVEAKRKELVGPLNDQVKRINDYAREIIGPIGQAKAHISDELKQFERVLEAQRQEALRIQREERLKEEVRVQAEIAKQREEADARARAVKEEAEAMAMFNAPDAAEIALAEAEAEAERIKSHAEAEAARAAFEVKQNHWDAKKEIEANKVAGTRRVWKFKLIDLDAVPGDLKIVSLDEKKIKAFISDGTRDIPGLEIFQELSITAR